MKFQDQEGDLPALSSKGRAGRMILFNQLFKNSWNLGPGLEIGGIEDRPIGSQSSQIR
jgi:hypothetical protein